MKAVIFGASGFIGGRITKFLSDQGIFAKGYSSETCNLLDKEALSRALENADKQTSIILCSAIPRMIEDTFHAMLKNMEMIHNICSHDYCSGIRSIVFLSSSDIYGAPAEKLPIDEKNYPMANSYYALSKYVSENILDLAFKGKSPVTMLRLPGIYGKGDKSRSIIGNFVHKALTGKEIVIYGDGEITRDYVEVEDLCRIVHYFICYPCHDVYNVATGNTCTLNEILKAVKENLNMDFNVCYSRKTDGRTYNLAFDNAKVISAISGFTFLSVKQGIGKYVSQLSQNCAVEKP